MLLKRDAGCCSWTAHLWLVRHSHDPQQRCHLRRCQQLEEEMKNVEEEDEEAKEDDKEDEEEEESHPVFGVSLHDASTRLSSFCGT